MGRMRTMLQGTGLAFVAIWSLVLGVQTNCAASSESQSPAAAKHVCGQLLAERAQTGTCSAGPDFLRVLDRACADSDGHTQRYDAQCSMTGAAVTSRALSFDPQSGALTATWALNAHVVDVSRPVLASFRYWASRKAHASLPSRLAQGGVESVPLALEATTGEGDWCTSAQVSVMATRDEKQRPVVRISAPSRRGAAVMVEGLYLVFESANGTADAVFFDECRDNLELSQCDPTEPGAGCACADPAGARGFTHAQERDKAMAVLLPLALVVLGAALALLAARIRAARQQGGAQVNTVARADLKLDFGDHDDEEENRGRRLDVMSHGSPKRGSTKPGSPSKMDWVRAKLGLDAAPQQASADAPHPEDAAVLHVSLDAILADALERRRFAEYLRAQRSSEALALFESIETFERCADAVWRAREAQAIVARFVASDGPYRVELRPAVQAKLCAFAAAQGSGSAGFRGAAPTLFDDAKEDAYALMQVRHLQGFLETAGPSAQRAPALASASPRALRNGCFFDDESSDEEDGDDEGRMRQVGVV